MPKVLKSLAQLLDEVPFAPVVAIMFGLVAGILVLATPGWLFERAVLASGLPPIIAATAPPLGAMARIVATILAVSGTTGILWLVFGPIEALMRPSVPQSRGHRIEPVYEATGDEVEPIALARRPLFANTDLGAPFMSDEAFAQARGELVLDARVLDEASVAPEPLDAPPPVPAAAPIAPCTVEQAPVSGPFDYLGPQEDRTDGNGPALPGDVTGRREVNGGSQLLH